MRVQYLDLADFVEIAAAVTGLDVATIVNMANLDLADSALHAPGAGFGEDDLYQTSSRSVEFSSFDWRVITRSPMVTREPVGFPYGCLSS